MSDGRDEAQEAEVPAEEAPSQEGPELREISDEDLQEILEEHRKWVESDGTEGKRADLRKTNLDGRNFEGVILKRAYLQGAYLRGANLARADLTEANLFHAKLQSTPIGKTNLSNTILIGANLQEANFYQAFLASADLRRATLMQANFQEAHLLNANLRMAKGKGTDFRNANLEESKLQNADLREAKLQGAHLKKSNWTDADLRSANLKGADLAGVEHVSGVKLGGANLDGVTPPRPIQEFEGLNTVEELSKSAKRIFQIMLLGCAYAWLTIATTTDARLITNSPSSPLPIIRTEIPIVAFYMAAPFLLLGLYIYFHLYLQRLWEGLADLPAVFPDGKPLDKRAYPWLLNGLIRSNFALLRGDPPPLSGLQAPVSIFLAWWFVPATLLLFWGRYLPRHDLEGTYLHVTLLAMSIGFGILSYRLARDTIRGKDVGTFEHYPRALTHGLWIAVIFFIVLSPGAINGIRPGSQVTDQEANIIREWVPRVLTFVGLRTFADFVEGDVSTKPSNWTGQNKQIPLVKGASLRWRDLRYANAYDAFLVKADLRNANLQSAELSLADLRGARLSDADLQEAILSEAELKGADLTGADLKGANLKRAKNLTAPQVKLAKNWELAFYDEKFLKKYGKELGLPQSEKEHTENVNKKLAELKKKAKAAAGKK